ncbi:MAG: prolipoprotein diacylglyceryl transferase [Candidatus Moranbacteria bacterium]|nr:prolipoprotein diacylglyceryl transferase [Candidatus Moranbacteria bacterium]
MSESWRYFAECIDPVALTAGPFTVRWYAICFILGFLVATAFLLRRARKADSRFDTETVWDAAFSIFFGTLLGGRLGYALLYDPSLLSTPMSLFLPIDSGTGSYSGIHGMSFFGALIGSGIVFLVFVRIRKLGMLAFADFVVSGVPLALFLGRIGNFLNLELVGRKTDVPWGIYLPDPSTGGTWELRHPSVLYEALLEGVVLFLFLAFLRKRKLPDGSVSAVFLIGYSVARFIAEFFREPDPGTGLFFGWMTMGQALSLGMLSVAVSLVVIFVWRNRSESRTGV